MGIEELWRNIYSNWYHNSSKCANCKANDEKNFWQPYYGIGSADPDVLFIGIDPGGAYGPGEKEMPRFYKNEKRDTGYEAPEPGDWSRKTDPLDVPGEAKGFVAKLLKLDDSLEITFTNVKKCSEIRSPNNFETEDTTSIEFDRREYNKSGEKTCSTAYLERELELLSPDVICTFGKAKNYILPHFGITSKSISSHTQMADSGLLSAYTEPQTILPVYHFSQRWTNITDAVPKEKLLKIRDKHGFKTDIKDPYQQLVAESLYAHLY